MLQKKDFESLFTFSGTPQLVWRKDTGGGYKLKELTSVDVPYTDNPFTKSSGIIFDLDTEIVAASKRIGIDGWAIGASYQRTAASSLYEDGTPSSAMECITSSDYLMNQLNTIDRVTVSYIIEEGSSPAEINFCDFHHQSRTSAGWQTATRFRFKFPEETFTVETNPEPEVTVPVAGTPQLLFSSGPNGGRVWRISFTCSARSNSDNTRVSVFPRNVGTTIIFHHAQVEKGSVLTWPTLQSRSTNHAYASFLRNENIDQFSLQLAFSRVSSTSQYFYGLWHASRYFDYFTIGQIINNNEFRQTSRNSSTSPQTNRVTAPSDDRIRERTHRNNVAISVNAENTNVSVNGNGTSVANGDFDIVQAAGTVRLVLGKWHPSSGPQSSVFVEYVNFWPQYKTIEELNSITKR